MIPAEYSPFPVSMSSHAGKGGQVNEDRYRVESFFLDEEEKVASLFAILADGIGAHRAGQVAAELAVETITRAVAHSDASQPTGILQAAIVQAGQAVLYRSESRREWKGMGSTCLCAWLVGDRLYMASVGNSRLFLLRGRRLQQLNVVHQLPRDVSPAVEHKRGRKKVDDDPLRGYLGSKAPVEIDLRLAFDASGQGRRGSQKIQGLPLLPNDRLLLCTDGLGDTLKPNEILEILGDRQMDSAAPDLVQFALEKGAHDNLTAVVIGIPPASPPLRGEPINWRRALASVLLFGLLVFLGLFAWWLWISRILSLNPPTLTPIDTLTPVATNTAIPDNE
ncbi:MAG: protein phosphatase 2C domain-containing protein [Chloroflexi bacterium]|nr:protein phosphatase 2C domain-containing protein [Chloroflexota bacterium]